MKFLKTYILAFFCLILLFTSYEAYALKTLVIINNNNAPIEQAFRLMSAVPYDSQTLDTAPGSVKLTFSRLIKPDKSRIRVYNLYGTQVNNDELTSDGMTLTVTLPELPKGKYSVKWRARCACDDAEDLNGTFRFSVR